MAKPWGGIGSWAAEAELAEAEERELGGSSSSSAAAPAAAFPSLKEAVTAKPKKKKMSLSEFYTSGSGSGSTRLTPDEMLQLPTGPKQRDPDEYGSGPRLGGGFSNYGDDRRGPRRGGFDDDRRGSRRGGGNDFDAPPPPPSRADEVDNWAAGKRAPVSGFESGRDSGRGSSRYGALGGGSRADEVDNWNFGKKSPAPARSGGFGAGSGGFRDSGSDWRRGGPGGGDLKDREEMGRPRLVLDPRTTTQPNEAEGGETPAVVVNAKPKSNPFGAARPREEVLAEKGLDWKKLDSEIEAKKGATSRPTSSQGSRPTSSQSSRSESVGVGGGTRPKVNPFGDAKPREVLLQEKGLDWRKIDLELEHRRVNRPETEEEKALKEEIENLKKELEKESGGDVSQESGGEEVNLRDLLQAKEKELEALTRELDDKVRFGQKAVERPGSGGAGRFTTGFPERPPSQSAGERPGSEAGRFSSFSERPPSQSGSFEDPRGAENMDRPRSRGTADVWTRPGEDRRGSFQGGRDRGFMGSRDFDRARSRERW